jgi:hypothetical protein
MQISPNDRYAVIGKSGCGKTHFCAILADSLVPLGDKLWQVWWIDSKLDPKDEKMLKRWGFTPYESRNGTNRKHIKLERTKGKIPDQAQYWADQAIQRGNVLIVFDEYSHVTYNKVSAGVAIEDIHKRGRGLNVGCIGQTQEPVNIPRLLASQANHIIAFRLTFNNDIKWMREIDNEYSPPPLKAFRWCPVDGDGIWRYYGHVKQWHDTLQ